MTRSSMLEILSEDFVRTASAKGLSPFRVVGVHALRNALIPVTTVIGFMTGYLAARRRSAHGKRSSPGQASASGSSKRSAGAIIRCCRAASC